MSERGRSSVVEAMAAAPILDVVKLSSLTMRPRQRFVLPFEEMPDGIVRFIDCRDKSRLDRAMRWGVVVFVWLIALVWFGSAVAVLLLKGTGLPAIAIAVFLLLGVAFATAGDWMRRGGRPRNIEIDMQGHARIRGPKPDRHAEALESWSKASLELRPFSMTVNQDVLRGFALLITDGRARVMLCAGETKSECIRSFEAMPAQVGSLPLHDSDRKIFGAEGIALWTTLRVMRQHSLPSAEHR